MGLRERLFMATRREHRWAYAIVDPTLHITGTKVNAESICQLFNFLVSGAAFTIVMDLRTSTIMLFDTPKVCER